MKEMTLNPLPVLTWNWLRMNKAVFSEEAEYANKTTALETSTLPEGAAFTSGKDLKAQEAAAPKSPAQIEGALGKDFDALLDQNSSQGQEAAAFLELKDGFNSASPLFVRANLEDGAASFKRLFVKAGDNVQATVIIEWTSEKSAKGLNAFQTKIQAGSNSRLKVATVQLLGSGFVHLNDIGCAAGENSAIEITQLELGADKIYQGIKSALASARSSFVHNAAYCLDGQRELDMNFVAEQTGRETKSLMNVYGTLKDGAKKTYRGTIDFKRGCAASVGNETEETLLLSPDVVNKSIPLILCDEEDVQGEHGATIGRLDEDLLFYMKTRGLPLEEAQKMMARSKIARVAALIGDDGEAQKALDFFDAGLETRADGGQV
ncbi:MAG: SufD family Fe-S cluster assembly protein [Treponema sp.]|nr:SufD family Fe-S cluster assembly protein [Treponema sp.]